VRASSADRFLESRDTIASVAVQTPSGQRARAVSQVGAKQRFIRAGRPETNGGVERVQRTILEEAWRPTFVRSLVRRYTALRRDLQQYLRYHNFERAHTGRRNQGQLPAAIVYKEESWNSKWFGGANRIRTDDLLRAREALSQLSYRPIT
jgi:hypothetical protein